MINYRKNKTRYIPNDLGSLYVEESKLKSNEQPIIYIGGQMEHRCHVAEQTGFTFDPGHNMFAGSWFYDYSILKKDKKRINAENCSKNLIEALKEANLHDVILITESFGGMIASNATKSELVSKVIAIHPPILGTPLANPASMDEYKQQFTKIQKLLLNALKVIVNPKYGFEQDNFKGLDLSKVDLNKLLVVGSYIDPTQEKNKALIQTYEMIRKVTGFRSDGVVVFEPSEYEKLGINYMVEDKNLSHLDAGAKKHIEDVYKKIF